ncbi:MAG: Fur family transcriptional regulator, ferric uptake regulator [Clostridia bacterium]|nr:Fur family transcriptional regulator, ferric uptake regulator [Clostridia bacterium]
MQVEGVRLTPQRRRVLQLLAKNKQRHLTAEEIYSLACQQGKKIGLATVYRSLRALEKAGLVVSMDLGDGSSRYELKKVGHKPHHHLVCLECGQVLEVDEALLESLWQTITEKYGFATIDQSIKIFGYCAACWHKRRLTKEAVSV